MEVIKYKSSLAGFLLAVTHVSKAFRSKIIFSSDKS